VEARLDTDESNLAPQTLAARKAYFSAFTEQDHRVLRALYYDSVTFMDEQIGRLLDAVEKLPNTIVVYLSDHGELLGDFRLYGKTAYHYDSCIRVPMICRWDGHWQAKRDNAIMELTDLMPTVLEAAGVNGPAMDGVSFAGRLAGGEAPRECAFIESYSGLPEDPSPAPVTWARTIRTDRYRATFYPRSEFGELFDLEADPHELRNVWHEQIKVREEHRRLLLDRLLAAEFPLR
jgi:arylsulfatase A-like enzyme